MAITFSVDDVVPAAELPDTHTLGEHLGDVLAFGGDGSTRVLRSMGECQHPLLGAIHVAFAEHRPLVLSPDAVWLTILRGVAQHVHLHAEALRSRLVRHQGKRKLVVTSPESLEQRPEAIREVVARLRVAVTEEIGSGPARLLTCDFSTTGDVERTASEILLMDTCSSYFMYANGCVCGIPEITLLGEADDWRSIRQRIDVLAELDLNWWTSSLAPILDEFVAASEGRPNAAFFRDIYKPRDAYAREIIVGWCARLYPYLYGRGRFNVRNSLLEYPLDGPAPERAVGRPYVGAGIRTSDVPSGLGSCVVEVDDQVTGNLYKLDVLGGLVAVEVDDQGRLAPCAGWTVQRTRAESRIDLVIERLRVRSDFEADPAESRLSEISFPYGDRVALADAFGAARLFVGPREWRLRAPSQARLVDVPVPDADWPLYVCRIIDLPDGSFIALAHLPRKACLLRLLSSELEEPTDTGPSC